jgi:Domain of unknown function (DUF4375)
MPEPLAKLFAEANDFDLCNGLFEHLLAFDGEVPDVSEMPEEERVVLLVWHTYGIIGNGGFDYLFGGDLPGDPGYSLAAEAYEAIGCEPAAHAFRQALALFPSREAPRDLDARMRIYRRGTGDRRGQIDREFFNAGKQIEACLARYIREHQEAYSRLEGRPKPKRAKREPRSEPEPRRLDPVAVGIPELPHWARVAFAARCARLVYPFFPRFWPDARPERPLSIARAAQLAERSAAAGNAAEGLERAARDALMTAGAALAISLYGYPMEDPEPGPPDGIVAVHASYIAKTAEFAARAALAGPKQSAEPSTQAYALARGLATGIDEWELVETMQREFKRLRRLARQGRWTHRSAVPPEVFDLDYQPEEPPKRWWRIW